MEAFGKELAKQAIYAKFQYPFSLVADAQLENRLELQNGKFTFLSSLQYSNQVM